MIIEVNFFKESGKWYTSEQVDFTGLYSEPNIHEAFKNALRRHLKDRLQGMWAICIEPWHKYPFPLMTRDW